LLRQVVADKASPIEGQVIKVTVDDSLKRKKAAERKERMRLKERLRTSISLEKIPRPEQKFLWLDYLFGISALDQRSGKEGSRLPLLYGGYSLIY
jgi:hypothetical protein